MMPMWFHVASVFVGVTFMVYGAKTQSWTHAIIGVVIFGMACFALGGA